MTKNLGNLTFAFFVLGLAGCATTIDRSEGDTFQNAAAVSVRESFLENHTEPVSVPSPLAEKTKPDSTDADRTQPEFRKLTSLDISPKSNALISLPNEMFSSKKLVSVSSEKMPITEFIHYIFGELLKANYILDPSLGSDGNSDDDVVTLSISEPVSTRDLFDLIQDVLIERGIQLKFGKGTFYIFRPDPSDGEPQVVIAIGRDASSVPDTAQKIMQVVPLKFGVKITLERTLKALSKAKITPDFSQSTVFVEGSREQILRAIELIDMLDTPAMRGKYIGLIELTFVAPNVLSEKLITLLENEGIDASIGRPAQRNLVLVPIPNMNSLAVFATHEFLLERARYWAQVIDVPGDGPEKQYFLYSPKYARAVDLEESISALLNLRGEGSPSGATPSSTGNAPSSARIGGASSEEISLVVDEKANVLVFLTTGDRYRALMPMLRKLDVMPKQVMMEITIAEVSMKEEFKYGVEWALSQGEVTLTTQGAFGASEVGGIGALINSNEGPVTGNFIETNNLVNILSRPTLMVRDGVSAAINIGSQISVVGQTTQDPISGDRQTTSSEYRNTGVAITVVPTVNAAGIVVMEVVQTISNTIPGSAGPGGNPDIFERSISTEVLASSGQTVMLGGLISENYTSGGSGAPFLSRVPVLGSLFKAQSDGTDRTELIMLITPRVVEDLSGWEPLIEGFRDSLKFIKLGSFSLD